MRWGVRSKLYGGFGLTVVALLIVGIVAITQLNGVGGQVERFSDETLRTEFLIWRSHFNMVQLRDQVPILAMAPEDMRQMHLGRMEELEDAIAGDLDELSSQPSLNETALALLADTERKLDNWYDLRDSTAVALALEGRAAAAADEALHGAASVSYQAADESIAAFHMEFRAIADAQQSDTAAAVTRSNVTMGVLVGLVVLASGALAFFLATSITNAVAKVRDAAANLAERVIPSFAMATKAVAQGDLTQNVSVDVESLELHSNDELGDMAASFNTMVGQLREMGGGINDMVASLRGLIGKVGATSEELATASDQLIDAADQAGQATQQITIRAQEMAQGAQEQAASSVQTAESMQLLSGSVEQIALGSEKQASGVEQALSVVEQVSGAIGEVARNAQVAAEASGQASNAARGGQEMVVRTIKGMGSIKVAVDTASAQIARLGDQSAEIGKIVAVIDDIAAQTNLLALNAAIEAARAGDQGRGFAVVADEVRGLAERVSNATKEIATLIETIQAGVDESVKAAEEGTREVANGVTLAEEAGKSIDEIMEVVEAVSGQIEEISAAAEEVSASGDEMVSVIGGVSEVVQQNAGAAEQVTGHSATVSSAIGDIAAVSKQTGGATQETYSSAEQVSAQVEGVVASSQSLSQMARELQQAVSVFNLGRENGRHGGVATEAEA